MIIFDLKLVLFFLLCLLTLCAGAGVWLGRRWMRQQADAQSHAKDEVIADLRRRQRAAQYLLRQVAHEVRAPISAIQTQAEIARIATLPEAARDDALRAIQREAQRAGRLIEAQVELGKLDLGEEDESAVRPVNLLLVVEEALAQSVQRAEDRRIELTLDAANALPLVPGNADQLKQVFLNLLDNAIKYCRPEDRVVISLALGEDHIQCAVRDTGPGIDRVHLPFVTQRLYRARTDVEGTGLGLAIVEAILRRHGSRLLIESATEGANAGTQFKFSLPLFIFLQ